MLKPTPPITLESLIATASARILAIKYTQRILDVKPKPCCSFNTIRAYCGFIDEMPSNELENLVRTYTAEEFRLKVVYEHKSASVEKHFVFIDFWKDIGAKPVSPDDDNFQLLCIAINEVAEIQKQTFSGNDYEEDELLMHMSMAEHFLS